jgi:hypothetical protein
MNNYTQKLHEKNVMLKSSFTIACQVICCTLFGYNTVVTFAVAYLSWKKTVAVYLA